MESLHTFRVSANAVATIGGRECLDRMLIFGRRHFERVLAEYIAHYNDHRPHRALGQRSPLTMDSPPPIDDREPADSRRSDAAFGLIHEYRLVA